jgi:hypothetical protein
MKESRDGDIGPEGRERDLEEWVPLSVREARRARERRDDLWPYVWIHLVSMILLFSALAIVCYRLRGGRR